MDLSTIKAVPRDVEILNIVTGEPTGLILTLRPLSSPEVVKVNARNQEERLRNRGRPLPPDKQKKNDQALLASAVQGWRWENGAAWGSEGALEFTPENVARVIASDFIAAQVDRELANESAFFVG